MNWTAAKVSNSERLYKLSLLAFKKGHEIIRMYFAEVKYHQAGAANDDEIAFEEEDERETEKRFFSTDEYNGDSDDDAGEEDGLASGLEAETVNGLLGDRNHPSTRDCY